MDTFASAPFTASAGLSRGGEQRQGGLSCPGASQGHSVALEGAQLKGGNGSWNSIHQANTRNGALTRLCLGGRQNTFLRFAQRYSTGWQWPWLSQVPAIPPVTPLGHHPLACVLEFLTFSHPLTRDSGTL